MQQWQVTLLCGSSAEKNLAAVKKLLQAKFCTWQQQENCGCKFCLQAQRNIYPDCLWLADTGGYGVQSAEQIIKFMALSADKNQAAVCVVENIENMSVPCANQLLKTIEEPPPGYSFIFTCQNFSAVLPTIKSRCHVVNVAVENSQVEPLNAICQEIVTFSGTAIALEKLFDLIENTEETHLQTMQYFMQLYDHAQRLALNETAVSIVSHQQQLLAVCQKFVAKPVGVGGSKIFWKSLVLMLL